MLLEFTDVPMSLLDGLSSNINKLKIPNYVNAEKIEIGDMILFSDKDIVKQRHPSFCVERIVSGVTKHDDGYYFIFDPL